MQRGSRIHLAALAGVLALAAWGSRPAHADVIPGWDTKAFGEDTQGSASADANGVWTLTGQSGDLWARDDHFFIVYKPLAGDGSVTTRLLTAEEGTEWSRIGVIMRDDLQNPDPQTFQLYMTSGVTTTHVHGIEAGYRGVTGAAIAKDQKAGPDGGRRGPPRPPVWFKIERRGDRMVGYLSADGAFWIPVTRSHQFSMKNEIVAGAFIEYYQETHSATFDGKVTDVSPKLLKPEEAAPLQPDPVIARGDNNAVILTWERVKHFDKDADGYVVYKAAAPIGVVTSATSFTKLAELPGDQTSYRDDTIKNGEQAQYRVTTLVKAGDKTLESQTYPGSEGILSYVTGAANPPISIAGRDFFAAVLDGGGIVTEDAAGKPVTDKPGGAAIDNGVVTLQASGWNIADRIDGGNQLMTPVTGDFTFTARVPGIPTLTDGTDANDNAKFGIAVRESTLANSRFASMLLTHTGSVLAPFRLFNDGFTDELSPGDTPALPVFLRIQRVKDTISMFTSTDGTTFTAYGDPVVLPGLVQNAYVGFIGTSADVGQIAQAKFGPEITLKP